ncbi:MAG: PLP-dependent aminotransferase family protein [Chitinophagaceae bacterium]
MSGSPVLEILSNMLVVNRKDDKAVYVQLAEQISTAVKGEIVPPGCALPGTRQLAETLHLHRKTIVAVYDELALQGIVTSIPNKGTFVNRDIVFDMLGSDGNSEGKSFPKKSKLSVPHNRILETTAAKPCGDFVWDDGMPDLRLFQAERLGIAFAQVFGKKYSHSYSFLQYVLTQYFSELHNTSVEENQIHVVPNRKAAIALTTLALLQKSDIVVVAEPGNYIVNMAVQQAGATLKTIPVERDGIDLTLLEELCKKQPIKMLYANPQNHYPTTTTMSYAKRLSLLRLANQYHFFIMEDETYSLYDFQKRKLPSLASLDTDGTVVYVHSFEQVMRPDWNIAFVVAPQNVLQEIRKYSAYMGEDETSIAQGIVASALQSGGLQRLVRKNTKIYQERRNRFCQLLRTSWGEYTHFEVPQAGLGLWLQFAWDFNLSAFAKKCVVNGITIPSHLLYQSRRWTAMRIGYGRWEEEEMEALIGKGKACF